MFGEQIFESGYFYALFGIGTDFNLTENQLLNFEYINDIDKNDFEIRGLSFGYIVNY